MMSHDSNPDAGKNMYTEQLINSMFMVHESKTNLPI